MADLQQHGVPIAGEAGVGHRMRAGFDLPPLVFTASEAQALVAAIRLARPRLDGPLADGAEAGLSKMPACCHQPPVPTGDLWLAKALPACLRASA